MTAKDVSKVNICRRVRGTAVKKTDSPLFSLLLRSVCVMYQLFHQTGFVFASIISY